jgi:hypothetical protein
MTKKWPRCGGRMGTLEGNSDSQFLALVDAESRTNKVKSNGCPFWYSGSHTRVYCIILHPMGQQKRPVLVWLKVGGRKGRKQNWPRVRGGGHSGTSLHIPPVCHQDIEEVMRPSRIGIWICEHGPRLLVECGETLKI